MSSQVASLPSDGGAGDAGAGACEGSLWHMLQEKEKEKKGEEKWRSEGGGVVTSRGRPATSPHAQHAAVEEVSRARGGVTASLSLRAVLHEAGALAALLRGAEGRVGGTGLGCCCPTAP
jgi:hypothetical protein